MPAVLLLVLILQFLKASQFSLAVVGFAGIDAEPVRTLNVVKDVATLCERICNRFCGVECVNLGVRGFIMLLTLGLW